MTFLDHSHHKIIIRPILDSKKLGVVYCETCQVNLIYEDGS